MSTEQSNNDLVWDMKEFKHRKLATDFVKRFENKLCVYSGSVEQLYSNYNIYFPEDEGRKMVILPDPYAYHDTFQGIDEGAIQMTGLTIVPGELIGKQGLHLTIPVKDKEGKRKYRVVPLQAGLQAINKRRPPDKPFLPRGICVKLKTRSRRCIYTVYRSINYRVAQLWSAVVFSRLLRKNYQK
jgi:hypothetical protein